MCGIVGAIAQRPVAEILLYGLKALEYRGYDSSGLCFARADDPLIIKSTGKVSALEALVKEAHADGRCGIAHTRWATHGRPTVENAHPHQVGAITLVHNGIIENYQELRERLSSEGYEFKSSTDTEVLAALIDSCLTRILSDELTGSCCGGSACGQEAAAQSGEGEGQYGSCAGDCAEHSPGYRALNMALSQVHGSYAVAVIEKSNPDEIIIAREGSPLVVGLGIGENFIASDVLALLPVTSRFIYLEEGDRGLIRRDHIELYDRQGRKAERDICSLESTAEVLGKGGFRHYMQKEIFEQPEALNNTMMGRLGSDNILADAFTGSAAAATSGANGAAAGGEPGGMDFLSVLRDIRHVEIVACGTSFHAGLTGKYLIEEYARVATTVNIASEFRYHSNIVPDNALFVTLSQSGETADTLAALRLARSRGYRYTLCICNVANSSLVRESDFAFLTRAGAEIGVASTKAFTTQLLALNMLTVALGRARNTISAEQAADLIAQIQAAPTYLNQVLSLDSRIEQLAHDFAGKQHALFLGRGLMYPVALEGALKLKEISYIHAEGYAAGELKHGPIALIDSSMPVIVVAPDNELLPKLVSNIEEVRARGGRLYIFPGSNFKAELDPAQCTLIPVNEVPHFISPVIFTVPLQLLSYHVAVINGTDVDQPRNLAKSVTVE